MKLQWYGHSCYSVSFSGGTVVFDPYADGSVPGLAPLRLTADAVYCSHGHPDHCATDVVTLTGRTPELDVRVLDVFHDENHGLRRGKNKIHILRADGLSVAHLGDLGHTLNRRCAEALRGVDALLIPVGGFYTIDAATAAAIIKDLGPRVVIPMHYRTDSAGYDVLSRLDAFTDLCGNVKVYPDNRFELTSETPPQTAVLQLPV